MRSHAIAFLVRTIHGASSADQDMRARAGFVKRDEFAIIFATSPLESVSVLRWREHAAGVRQLERERLRAQLQIRARAMWRVSVWQ